MLQKDGKGRYMFGIYYNLKDIGIPGVVCEKFVWDEVVMKDLHENRVVVKKDEKHSKIIITPVDEDNCENSIALTMGIISPLVVASGGKKRKTKRTHSKKKTNKIL